MNHNTWRSRFRPYKCLRYRPIELCTIGRKILWGIRALGCVTRAPAHVVGNDLTFVTRSVRFIVLSQGTNP